MKLLVADDDPTLRAELADLLRSDGHEVATAADGHEALEALEAEAYDVALLDLMMPRATGLEILHRLEASRRPTSVVMITGHGSIDVAVEAMKAGAVDFVVKPFEFESLQRILHAIQDERRARATLASATPTSDVVRSVVDAAVQRKALLAVVGGDAKPPKGAIRVLRLGLEPRPPDVFTPSQLYQLNAAIGEHVGRVESPVVYVSRVGELERVHGRDDLRAWIRQVSQKCAAKGGTLVVAGMDRGLLAEVETGAGLEVDPGLQGMLESLANPIRRAIVSYVYGSGPVAYSAILKMNFVDSSSKLSFHLQKLQSDRLLTKNDAGAYLLTEDGHRAWRVVHALGGEVRAPPILFTPG